MRVDHEEQHRKEDDDAAAAGGGCGRQRRRMRGARSVAGVGSSTLAIVQIRFPCSLGRLDAPPGTTNILSATNPYHNPYHLTPKSIVTTCQHSKWSSPPLHRNEPLKIKMAERMRAATVKSWWTGVLHPPQRRAARRSSTDGVHDTAARTSVLLERLGDLSEGFRSSADESGPKCPRRAGAAPEPVPRPPAYQGVGRGRRRCGRADAPAAVFLDADETTIVCEAPDVARRAAGCVAAAVRAVQDAPGAHPQRPQRAARVLPVSAAWPPQQLLGRAGGGGAAGRGQETNFLFGCHGGCLLPNIAMAVRSLWAAEDLERFSKRATARRRRRVAVVDLDAHFGDGTALLFARDRDCLAVSLHWAQHAAEEGDPRFFPFLQGAPDERMEDGTAPESTVSLPLPTGASGADALAALAGAAERVRAFAPARRGRVRSTASRPTRRRASRSRPRATGRSWSVLEMCGADVPCVCVLEGGYDPRGVAESFEAVARSGRRARGKPAGQGLVGAAARQRPRRRRDGRGDDLAAEADGGARGSGRVRRAQPSEPGRRSVPLDGTFELNNGTFECSHSNVSSTDCVCVFFSVYWYCPSQGSLGLRQRAGGTASRRATHPGGQATSSRPHWNACNRTTACSRCRRGPVRPERRWQTRATSPSSASGDAHHVDAGVFGLSAAPRRRLPHRRRDVGRVARSQHPGALELCAPLQLDLGVPVDVHELVQRRDHRRCRALDRLSLRDG